MYFICKCRYKKLFMRLLDMALFNAFVMMRVNHPKISFLHFRLNLVRQMIQLTGGTSSSTPSPSTDQPLRLTGRHFPSKCPKTMSNKASSRRCHVCAAKSKKRTENTRKRSSFWCAKCQVPLCVVPCFELFHTKVNF